MPGGIQSQLKLFWVSILYDCSGLLTAPVPLVPAGNFRIKQQIFIEELVTDAESLVIYEGPAAPDCGPLEFTLDPNHSDNGLVAGTFANDGTLISYDFLIEDESIEIVELKLKAVYKNVSPTIAKVGYLTIEHQLLPCMV